MCTYAPHVDEHRGETSPTEHPTLAASVTAPCAATPAHSASQSFLKRIQLFKLTGQPKPVVIEARFSLELCYCRSNKLACKATLILGPGHKGRLQDQAFLGKRPHRQTVPRDPPCADARQECDGVTILN